MTWSDDEDDSPAAGYTRRAPARRDDSDEDDSDWEKPVRRRPAAADGDDDDDDEDEWEKKSAEREPSPAKEAEKPKKKKKDDQKPLDDPVAEKLRLLKLQQKADKEMASDLFGGEFARSDQESSEEEDDEEPKRTPRGDDSDDDDEDKETPTKVIHSFNDLVLRREGDVEKLVSLMKKKFEEAVKEGNIKGPFKTYFEAMMANLEQYFTEKEVESIIKKIEKTMSDKKKAKAAKEKEEKEKKEKEEQEKSASAAAAPKTSAKKNKFADKEDIGVKTGNDDGFYDAFM